VCIYIYTYIQFFALFWPDVVPNWSPLNKHIRKSLLVVTGEFLDLDNKLFPIKISYLTKLGKKKEEKHLLWLLFTRQLTVCYFDRLSAHYFVKY
jgi:hypothetical protein